MTESNSNGVSTTGVERRTVLKGAAWALPAVAVAGSAPFAAATGVGCDGCYAPDNLLLAPLGLTLSASLVDNNTGVYAFAGTLGVDASGCEAGLLTGLAYVGTVLGAELTWRHGASTLVRNADGDVINGIAPFAGVLGTTIGALAGAFAFGNLPFPDGLYAGSNPPAEPVGLCVHMSFAIDVAVLNLGFDTLTCQTTLCWELSTIALGTVATVPVIGPVGAGTVTYTGLDVTPLV